MKAGSSRKIKIIDSFWFKTGHLNIDQRNFFIELLERIKPKYCLEIGFASGRSTVTTLVAAKPKTLISIDIDLDYIKGARKHAALLQKKFPQLKVLEKDSKKIFEDDTFFSTYFSKGIDFVFVDGDHTYEGCRHDLEKVLPHLNKGGVIVVDDYRSGPPNGVMFPPVTQAIEEFVWRHNVTLNRWNRMGKGIAEIRASADLNERLKTVGSLWPLVFKKGLPAFS